MLLLHSQIETLCHSTSVTTNSRSKFYISFFVGLFSSYIFDYEVFWPKCRIFRVMTRKVLKCQLKNRPAPWNALQNKPLRSFPPNFHFPNHSFPLPIVPLTGPGHWAGPPWPWSPLTLWKPPNMRRKSRPAARINVSAGMHGLRHKDECQGLPRETGTIFQPGNDEKRTFRPPLATRSCHGATVRKIPRIAINNRNYSGIVPRIDAFQPSFCSLRTVPQTRRA